MGAGFGAAEVADAAELADLMRLELCAVSEHFGVGHDAGTMEAVPDGMDADEKARQTAASVAVASSVFFSTTGSMERQSDVRCCSSLRVTSWPLMFELMKSSQFLC